MFETLTPSSGEAAMFSPTLLAEKSIFHVYYLKTTHIFRAGVGIFVFATGSGGPPPPSSPIQSILREYKAAGA